MNTERMLRRALILFALAALAAAGVNATDLANEVVMTFGSLDRLGSATVEELSSVKGVGPAKAASIVAAFELARRASRPNEACVIRRAADVAAIASPMLSGLRHERVLVVVCDRRGRVIRTVVVADGSADRAMFPVREILNVVLRHDGGAFAIAHNHPSGDATPSESDSSATEAVAAGAKAVGLRFLGHVVVTSTDWAEVTLSSSRRTSG